MMKRTLWFLILILVVLNACSARKPSAQVTPAQTQVSPMVAATETKIVSQPAFLPLAGSPLMPVTGNAVQATAPQNEVKVMPTVAPVSVSPEAAIGEGGLNLRYGPGLNYRVSRVLNQGETVRLEGRSQDGDWIVARLPDGSAGWVFGAYLQTKANLAALPMLEASGGPVSTAGQPQPQASTTAAPKPRGYSLNMSIVDNQADVSLARFPANSEVTIRLGVRGEGPVMTVATAKTDENGSASVTFDMPDRWPDGSPITQSELRLTASTADGSFSGGANITYSAGE